MMISTTIDRWIDTGTPSFGAPRVDTGRERSSEPSAMGFVAAVVLASIAAAMGMALLVAAPRTVTVPIAVALAAGLLATGAAVAMDRRMEDGSRARAARRSRRAGEGSRGSRWAAVVAASLALLVLSLVAPDPLGAGMTATGLVGLLSARIAAASGRWPLLPGGSNRAGHRAGD